MAMTKRKKKEESTNIWQFKQKSWKEEPDILGHFKRLGQTKFMALGQCLWANHQRGPPIAIQADLKRTKFLPKQCLLGPRCSLSLPCYVQYIRRAMLKCEIYDACTHVLIAHIYSKVYVIKVFLEIYETVHGFVHRAIYCSDPQTKPDV